MNKAAFLDILNHVSSISEQEVIELEKLALNFPYCQSAHLLLAKAAYDRGSMLSNQRLRRAAACAANRQLLKKLVYTSGMQLVLEPIHQEETEPLPVLEPIEAEPLEIETYDAVPVETPAPAATPESEAVPVLEPIEIEILELESQDSLPAAQEATGKEPLPPEELVLTQLPEAPLAVEVMAAALPDIYEVPDLLEDADITAWVAAPAMSQPQEPEPVVAQQPGLATTEQQPIASRPDETEDFDDLFAVVMAGQPVPVPMAVPAAAPQLHEAEDLDDLFAVDYLAPLVAYQDPVMAFVSTLAPEQQAETGQGDPEAGTMPAATSPEAAPASTEPETVVPETEPEAPQENAPDTAPAGPVAAEDSGEADETITQFDNYLFTPEKEDELMASSPSGVAYQEEIIYKVFDANELGYWMDSSRLGETLLRKNELATAQPYFFRPELLLEYSRHHEIASYQAPEPSVLTRQLDIIDQFLKLNPKIKSMASLKIKPESQEDLSLKSTKIKKSVASETLANILVQQGKIKKAIKIYEHLILKLPEKKDYFASQIEKLQNIT